MRRGRKEHLALLSQSRFVCAEGVARTHNVRFVKPELVADEVQLVFRSIL